MNTPAQWLLRIAVAFAFVYPAQHAVNNPDSWIGYFPPFMFNLGIPPEVLLHGFGVVEIILAVWILWGWRLEIPSVVAAVMLMAIVVFNLVQFEILFRDVSIALAALALAADAWHKSKDGKTLASE